MSAMPPAPKRSLASNLRLKGSGSPHKQDVSTEDIATKAREIRTILEVHHECTSQLDVIVSIIMNVHDDPWRLSKPKSDQRNLTAEIGREQ